MSEVCSRECRCPIGWTLSAESSIARGDTGPGGWSAVEANGDSPATVGSGRRSLIRSAVAGGRPSLRGDR